MVEQVLIEKLLRSATGPGLSAACLLSEPSRTAAWLLLGPDTPANTKALGELPRPPYVIYYPSLGTGSSVSGATLG